MPRHTAERRDKLAELVPHDDQASALPGPPGPNRKADPGPAVAGARLERLCEASEIPASTMRALIARGQGPRTFTIGRLLFCLIEDWNSWMQSMANAGGTGRIAPPTGRVQPAPVSRLVPDQTSRETNRETTAKTSNSIK